jgi:hypothetical protein
MKISFALANKLASFKNQKQPFEKGGTYTLNYNGEEATEETLITIDETREITVADLLNLFASVQTEKVGEFEFMKKGERAITLGQSLAEAAKKVDEKSETFELPKSITIENRVTVGTSMENVEKLDNVANIKKGYELHGIDTTQERIPQLWATSRKDAKYDKKEDFKVRTKVVVSAQ